MKDKNQTYEKAKLFMDKVLQDESTRSKNIKALMELKRIAKASDMLNNFAIAGFGASAVAVGTAFILGGITMPILASIILGASVIGVIGATLAKIKGDGNYAIKRVYEHKKEQEKDYILSKDATINYLGDLTLSQLNKLGKYVSKQFPENAKTAKAEIQFELENTYEKEEEQASEAIYDSFATVGKTISKIITKSNKQPKEEKQLELEAKKKKQAELDKDLGINL